MAAFLLDASASTIRITHSRASPVVSRLILWEIVPDRLIEGVMCSETPGPGEESRDDVFNRVIIVFAVLSSPHSS
jgi:hypothetical protein